MSDDPDICVESQANSISVCYSVVVPVYNEEESVEVLFGEISEVMKSTQGSYEVVFVNDCSSDI